MDGTAHIITLDFETPYSTDYSLSKLTYEDYIYDPRFKPHGVGIKIDNRPTRYYKNNIRGVLAGLFTPGNQHTLICHNAMFDGAVLSWHYGLTAGKYYCTERLSKALWHAGSASLGALAKRLFPDDTSKRKGDELVQFKSRFSLTDEEQHTLGLYCCNDVELTYECFRVMYPFVPAEELEVLSLTLRMFIEPSLVLDRDAVEVYLKDLETDKAQVIQASGLDKKLLASNDQFAAWIQAQGIPFSQIPSPTPKNKANMKWPLSKNAPEFIALQANYPQYNPMWDARIAVKSTQEVTRARRLLAHSARTGRIAMPLNYAAAHTLRWGGTNRINPQNFGQDSKLRPALLAPPGYQVMVIDLKNIEMRLLAWLAGETLILDALKQGKDLYREFAAEVFRKPVEYVTGLERFIGKTCLAPDTLVYTNQGLKPIIGVADTDTVWDGEAWVQHDGVICQGNKQTIRNHGVAMTPCHEVLTDDGWVAWQEVHNDPGKFQAALSLANSPYCGTSITSIAREKCGVTAPFASARAVLKQWFTKTALQQVKPRAAINAQKLHPQPNAIGNTSRHSPTISTERAYSIGYLRRLVDAIRPVINPIPTTANAESSYTRHGAMIAQNFSSMFKHYLAGMIRTWTWTASTMAEATSPVILDSLLESKTLITDEPFLPCRSRSELSKDSSPVYDLANCGPRHRFMIHTEHGPVIVHNCILGLGYYMGHNKLHLQLATGKQRVNFTLDECKTFVQAYRRKYRRITRLWELADGWCRKMCEPTTNENYKCLTIEPGRIGFPSGMYLNFPTIKAEWGPHEQFDGITYWNGKHRTDLYSGKLVENIIQRLARDVIRDYLLQVDAYLLPNGGRVVLQVHDEIVALVPEDLAITAYDHASAIMRQPPAFCADGSLVLDVDGGCARNYAKAA